MQKIKLISTGQTKLLQISSGEEADVHREAELVIFINNILQQE